MVDQDAVITGEDHLYKGQSVDIRRIAADLGVRYVVEGSVRRSGARIRISVQLIDGENGRRVWGDRYERELSDIFQLQDEITTMIAGTIGPELEMIDAVAQRAHPAADLNAWDCYQRGLWHLYRFTTDELEEAKSLFERAITLDINFSQAYSRLAYVHIQLGWYGANEGRAERLAQAITLANQALELDRRDASARISLGRALTLSGKTDVGIEELRTAIALDPSFALGRFALGQALCFVEEHQEALDEINEAIRLSPRDPHFWTFLNVRAIANYQAGLFEQAEIDERAAMREPNATHWPAFVLLAVLGRLGKTVAAQEVITAVHRARPGFTCSDARKEWYFGDEPFISEKFVDQFLKDVRAAGPPE